MPINFFGNAFSRLPQNQNMSQNGFSMRPKRNPFRGLSFEQPEQEEQEQGSFFENYPRPNMSAYEQFLQEEKRPQFERSKGAKIAAAVLAGLGGYAGNPNALKDTNAALRAPYEREMEQYELEGGRLKELSGLESARIKQEREILDSIRDYELKKADDARADLLARNTLRLGDNTIRNTDSLIENRPLSVQGNDLTGNKEVVNQLTGNRRSLGAFAPSYGQKRTDESSEFDRRAGKTFANQQANTRLSSALSFGNAKRLREFDLNNPSPNSFVPPSQQRDAEEMADQELLYGPNSKYSDLVEQVIDPNTKQPIGFKIKDLKSFGTVEGQILEDMLKEYQREKAIRVNEILTKPRGGRFEITPIK